MPADLFERLSGGRFIDLGSRLSSSDIQHLGGLMKKTCPECGGMCIIGMAIAITEEGLLPLPIACDLCGGEGDVMYRSHN